MISGAKLKPAFGWFILTMGNFLVSNTVITGCKVIERESSGGFVDSSPVTAQQEEVSNSTPNEITAKELSQLMTSGEKPFLLDVRRAEERDISVLDDDAHIPIDEIEARITELDKDADIVIYCRTGNRSGIVTEFLKENGFANVRNLVGGINGWSAEIDSTIQKYGD